MITLKTTSNWYLVMGVYHQRATRKKMICGVVFGGKRHDPNLLGRLGKGVFDAPICKTCRELVWKKWSG